jgi:hypothetical protein
MSLKRPGSYFHKLFSTSLLALSVATSGCLQNKNNQAGNQPGNQSGNPRVEESANQKHDVSGVNVTDQSFRLLQEIESLYGKPVKVEQTQYNDQSYGGESTVSADGVPGISLNIKGLEKETTLVHELFHLKLRFEGFPSVYVPASAPNVRLDQKSLLFVKDFFKNVNDVMLHTIFFPEMRKMGLNPSSKFNTFLRSAMEKGDVDKTAEFVPRTFLYYMALMECDDRDLISKLENRFRNNRWEDSIAEGKRLAQQTKAAPPKTPQDLINSSVSLMNELMKGRGSFRFLQWGQDVKKGRLSERTAVILVEPVAK